MSELIKIKDVSAKYAITARTLRYYEDIGLITSVRSEGYAHRMYDELAITRLKQILILRKLSISVKDIKLIFTASDSEMVLEILGKKAEDIDDEVALLHELKRIVLDFINQIKQSDFHNDSEVKLLYEKAKEIETQLTTSDYNGNPSTGKSSTAEHLLEVTEKLDVKRITTPVAVKTYRQSVGAMRFIGKKFTSGAEAWNAWGSDLDEIHDNVHTRRIGISLKDLYEDGDSLIGLMRHSDGNHNNFEYWLGYFTPENTPVPEGYDYEDFPKTDIGTCWIYGHQDEVFAVEPIAFEKLKEEGFEPIDDWWFERYHPMRSNEDKKGNIIIDICFFLK